MSSSQRQIPRPSYPDIRSMRGQLDPPDASPRNGWRYVQCTDKQNELRVLIPPRTALIYDSLLRTEKNELSKGDPVASHELRFIRHLKDRMIRKCHRLCNWIPPADRSSIRPQDIYAPGDFRLKEMEQWWLFKQLPAEEDAAMRPHRTRVRRRDSSGSKSTPSTKPQPPGATEAPRTRRSSRTSPQLAPSLESHTSKSGQVAGVIHIPPKVSSRNSASKGENIPSRERKVSMTARDNPPSNTPRKLQKRPPNVVLQDNHAHNIIPPMTTPVVSPPVTGEVRPSMPPKRPSSPRNPSTAVGSPFHRDVSEAHSAMRSPTAHADFNYTSYFELKTSPKAPSASPGAVRRLSTAGMPAQSPPAMTPAMKLQAQYESQYRDRSSASPNSPPRTSAKGTVPTSQDTISYLHSRQGSEDRSPVSIPQQQMMMPGYSSSASSRHTNGSTTSSSRPAAQVSPKPAQQDESYLRKHQQRASSMPLPQNTDFYPPPDGSMNSPPLADRSHGRRATVDNGYSHERAQTMPSHRSSSYLGPVPLVGSDQGRFSSFRQTSYPQVVPGLTSQSRPSLNPTSPSAATTGIVYENRPSPSMVIQPSAAIPQAHRVSADIGSQTTSRKIKESGGSPSQFDPSANVLNRPSPQQQVQQQQPPHRRASVDKAGSPSSFPVIVEATHSPPIMIYRGAPPPQPEHYTIPAPAPPISIAFPDVRDPYAPISLSKPSPTASRRSSIVAVGTEPVNDSFYAGLEFGDQASSRPVSRLSSVSDPVIPDASLLVEAAVLRGREKPFRPRLYDYASSESPFNSEDEDDDSDDDDDNSDGDDDRPARPRSRGSIRSVRSSRSAGDPGPSILKRSGSRCSQRSAKSVRLDIPDEQAAVQEVRAFQDQVYDAGLKVEEARRRWDRGEDGAEIAFKEAQQSLREMYARLREKEESFKRLQATKRSEKQAKDYVNRYVAQ